MTDDERFWKKVDCSGGADACWPWTKSLNRKGYGYFDRRGKRYAAHRVAFGVTRLWVLHRCDNPPCCNPRHLFEGTAYDNAHDMIDKGRGFVPAAPPKGVIPPQFREMAANPLRGEANPIAKLTTADVLNIRASTETQVVAAKRYGVSQSTVSRIRAGNQWAHLLGTARAG